MWRVNLRPEEYANAALSTFLSINDDKIKSIHDERVALRKYSTVLEVLYPIHKKAEVVCNCRNMLKLLGRIRNYDIVYRDNTPIVRRKMTDAARERKRKFKVYYLPVIYGSRLLLMRDLVGTLKRLRNSELSFHQYRQLIRKSKIICESLGYESTLLNNAAKELGKQLDQSLVDIDGELNSVIDKDLYMEWIENSILELDRIIKTSQFKDIA